MAAAPAVWDAIIHCFLRRAKRFRRAEFYDAKAHLHPRGAILTKAPFRGLPIPENAGCAKPSRLFNPRHSREQTDNREKQPSILEGCFSRLSPAF